MDLQRLTDTDEVSALVVDFGSHTTRAGYAGEDCPRVVCPSFYGYTQDPSSSSNGAASAEGISAAGGDGDVTMGESNGEKSEKSGRKGRKYYVGDDGVNVWRGGMEVDNFMLDGIGESDVLVTVCMERNSGPENARKRSCRRANVAGSGGPIAPSTSLALAGRRNVAIRGNWRWVVNDILMYSTRR